jgi:membrane glycosyltransferase
MQPAANPPDSFMILRRTPGGDTKRVFVFYSLAVLLTGFSSLLFADLLWRFGWSASRTVELVLFAVLFMVAAIGCAHAVYGFMLRRLGGGERIALPEDCRDCDIGHTRTALLFPMHNEDVPRVYEGLRATYHSLAQTGQLEQFDFFILSDSTNPSKWIEEERRWVELVRELGAPGRIHYRHRLQNEGKKSGNIRDFLKVWGLGYRYFIVFDADSVMRGELLVHLVRLMEAYSTVGLIQTATALVRAETLFARVQQFANRLYGPIFFSGLNYWAQDGGNYWGHNAIIRTEPFMQFCDLPRLPGKKPFGGQILSHDFIEAALIRKENWEVWFAWDLEGSYEEGPPGIIDNAQRDRRWCEGNLQHFLLLFARGMRGVNRVHLTLGIVSYLAGPLWLLFMLDGTYMLWYRKMTGLSDVAVAAFTPFLRVGVVAHALLVFGLSMFVIFLPKFLSLLDLVFDRERRRAFGGLLRASAGAFCETIFSTLLAPVQMLFHTLFVISTIMGHEVRWEARTHGKNGTTWSDALRNHWWQTALGVCWGAGVWSLEPKAFWWFLPVLAGMVVAIPLSVFTSRKRAGEAFRNAGLFLTPEEIAVPAELALLDARLSGRGHSGTVAGEELREVIMDPYLNAIHVSLLLQNRPGIQYANRQRSDPEITRIIAEKLLSKIPVALTNSEETALLSEPDTLLRAHHEAWKWRALE